MTTTTTTETGAPALGTIGPSGADEDREVPATIERHGGNGRPKILPRPELVEAAKAAGEKPPTHRYYHRASSLGKALESTYNLERWQQRMVLLGVLHDPSLMLRVSAYSEDRDKLNEIAAEAQTLAKAHSRREVGTALHKLTEIVDDGGDVSKVPAEYRADLAAYRDLTREWEIVARETFVVCDPLEAAGSFDRLRLLPAKPRSKAPRKARIVDVKTGGGSLDYAQLSYAVQLAVYANGERYDPATGARSPLGQLPDGRVVEIDTRVAEILWLPAGAGRAELFEIDVEQGRMAGGIAKSIAAIRSDAKGWIKPAGTAEATLLDLVESAPDEAALFALYEARGAEFDATVGAAASARLALLRGGVLA